MKQLKKSGQNVLQGKRTDEKNLKIANDRIVIEGTKTETYSGPLPHPSILQGYKQIEPDFPMKVVNEWERNSAHIREQEQKELDLQIKKELRGQWMAFIVSALSLSIVLVSVLTGNIAFAGVSALAAFALIAKAFLQK